MTAEWVAAIAGLGTLVVISASAVAALIQLRHMRGSNQIVALTECRETLESPEFRAAQRFVSWVLPERLKDPAECRKIGEIPPSGEYEQIVTVANFFESMGLFVKYGIIDRRIACDFWAYVVLRNWDALVPVITYARRALGSPALFENFEYLAYVCRQSAVVQAKTSYPPGLPRMPTDDSLIEMLDLKSG